MTRKINIRKGIARITWAWCLAFVLAFCMSCVAFAAEAKTFDQTMLITQTVSGNASRTKYTYVLKPNIEGSPLPTEGPGTYDKDKNTYTFTLDGNASIEIPIKFTVEEEANYQYLLVRVEEVPEGDTVTPENHHFGYLFRVKDGEMTITPYTCYDNHFEIWDKTDKDGNPIGVTLENTITSNKGDKGDQGDKGDPGKDGSDGKNGTNGTDGKNGTNGTNGRNGTNGTSGTSTVKTITQTVGKAINTGDPNHILLWGGLIILSAGALVAIIIVRRKKEKDEENS